MVYISPEKPSCAVKNPYDEIENKMRRFSTICSSVLIFGDLNSRSKKLQDYVLPDNDLFENLNLKDVSDEWLSEFSYFKENNNFRPLRQNSDTGLTNYGYRMIDFSIGNDLLIINRRGNTNSGYVTCTNVITVDFFFKLPRQCFHC